MKRIYIYVFAAFILYFTNFLLPVKDDAKAQCNQRGRIIINTNMWDRPPQLTTGQGLIYGIQLASLNVNTQVLICNHTGVGFGFQTQLWYQIAVWNIPNRRWDYGWVFSGHVAFLQSYNVPKQKFKVGFISEAIAQETDLKYGKIAPEAPSPHAPKVEIGIKGSLSDEKDITILYYLYLYMFAAMIIGMVAKECVALLVNWGDIEVKKHLRKGFIPLLISPIVFLSFMQTADFQIDAQRKFIILLLLAFQNGFFWQTVFNLGSESKTGRNNQVDAGGQQVPVP